MEGIIVKSWIVIIVGVAVISGIASGAGNTPAKSTTTAKTAPTSGTASNLVPNFSFDDTENPLKYWTYDYREKGNANYMNNHEFVKFVAQEDGRKNVMKVHGRGGDAGTWIESPAVPYEPGARYKVSFMIKGSKGHHIYLCGYGWKPGIRPYENPNYFDLRQFYRGGWIPEPGGGGWQKMGYEWPMEKLSELAKKGLRQVRMLSVHFWIHTGDVFIDEMVITQISPANPDSIEPNAKDAKAYTKE